MSSPTQTWICSKALHGDASDRRYERVWDRHGHSAVRVLYPAGDRRRFARDLEIRSWLASRLRVPDLLEEDLDACTAVFEDLGDEDAEVVLRQGSVADCPTVAAAWIGPLRALAAMDPEQLPAWNRPLDENRLRWELAGFELWFLSHLRDSRGEHEIQKWLDELATSVASHPTRVCHRDYHLNNLFHLRDGSAVVIDYQDVLVGPDTYDAASLTGERAFPDVFDRDATERWLAEWAALTNASPGWRDRVTQAQTQRGLKVLGTFARLVAGGRREYASWMPGLARTLAERAPSVDMPPLLRDHLLDWALNGGSHARWSRFT